MKSARSEVYPRKFNIEQARTNRNNSRDRMKKISVRPLWGRGWMGRTVRGSSICCQYYAHDLTGNKYSAHLLISTKLLKRVKLSRTPNFTFAAKVIIGSLTLPSRQINNSGLVIHSTLTLACTYRHTSGPVHQRSPFPRRSE